MAMEAAMLQAMATDVMQYVLTGVFGIPVLKYIGQKYTAIVNRRLRGCKTLHMHLSNMTAEKQRMFLMHLMAHSRDQTTSTLEMNLVHKVVRKNQTVPTVPDVAQPSGDGHRASAADLLKLLWKLTPSTLIRLNATTGRYVIESMHDVPRRAQEWGVANQPNPSQQKRVDALSARVAQFVDAWEHAIAEHDETVATAGVDTLHQAQHRAVTMYLKNASGDDYPVMEVAVDALLKKGYGAFRHQTIVHVPTTSIAIDDKVHGAFHVCLDRKSATCRTATFTFSTTGDIDTMYDIAQRWCDGVGHEVGAGTIVNNL